MNKKIYFSPEVTISIIKNIKMMCVSAGFGGDDEETTEMHTKYRGFDSSDAEGTDDALGTFRF